MPDARNRLLLAALASFAEQGFDATSVQALLDATGLSKGAFYHHFASKDALLDAVVDELSQRGIARVKAQVRDAGCSALEQYRAFIAASRQWQFDNLPVVAQMTVVLYREENGRVRRGVQARTAADLLPLLSEILDLGVREGCFDVAHVEETARLLLRLGHAVGDTQILRLLAWDGSEVQLETAAIGADVFAASVERVLALPPGSLPRPSNAAIRLFAEALRQVK